MIKNDFILIKTKGNRKLPYFESLGYKIEGDEFLVKVTDLNSGSREIIDAICDYCDRDVKVNYKEYLRNIKIGNKYACSKECGCLKAKESNIIKYGVENPLNLKEIQEKQKKTNFEKYGVEYLQQSVEIKEKSKKTLMERYGIDHISKRDDLIDLSRTWMLSDEFKNKAKQSFLKKYGVDNPTKSTIVIDKLKQTLSNKTELDWNSVSQFKCLKCDSLFEINYDNFSKRRDNNLPICTLCNPIGEIPSIKEKELYNYIKSIYNKDIIRNYRSGLEIDIYLPDLKIGFEFNGLYWHSGKFKDKNYHLDKTKYFENIGIRIIHIWEDDWSDRRLILESQVKNWLGLIDNKIFARRCRIREVIYIDCRDFLNRNHIQGSDKNKLRLGLYHNENLVSLMTFSNFEGRKKMETDGWNLSRFCNILGTNVIGGASKLLNYFIKNYNPKRIVSYADRDWSRGDVYYNLGFKKIGDSCPDYKYVVNCERKHKSNFKKSILKTDLSESIEMKNRNIDRVWDCGKIKFEMIL